MGRSGPTVVLESRPCTRSASKRGSSKSDFHDAHESFSASRFDTTGAEVQTAGCPRASDFARKWPLERELPPSTRDCREASLPWL